MSNSVDIPPPPSGEKRRLPLPKLMEVALTTEVISSINHAWFHENGRGNSINMRQDKAAALGEKSLGHLVLMRDYLQAHPSGSTELDGFLDFLDVKQLFYEKGGRDVLLMKYEQSTYDSEGFYESTKQLIESNPVDETEIVSFLRSKLDMTSYRQFQQSFIRDYLAKHGLQIDGKEPADKHISTERFSVLRNLIERMGQGQVDAEEDVRYYHTMTELLFPDMRPDKLKLESAAAGELHRLALEVRSETGHESVSQEITLIQEYYESVPYDSAKVRDDNRKEFVLAITSLLMHLSGKISRFDRNAHVMANFLNEQANRASRGTYAIPTEGKQPPLSALVALANKLAPMLSNIDGRQRSNIKVDSGDRQYIDAADIIAQTLAFLSQNHPQGKELAVVNELRCIELLIGRLEESVEDLANHRTASSGVATEKSDRIPSIRGNKTSYFKRWKSGYGQIS